MHNDKPTMKNLTWTLSKTKSTPVTAQEVMQAPQPAKKRLLLSLPNKEARFSLPTDTMKDNGAENMLQSSARFSIFTRTDSTAATSMCDLTGSMSQVGTLDFARRSSINPQVRRQTMKVERAALDDIFDAPNEEEEFKENTTVDGEEQNISQMSINQRESLGGEGRTNAPNEEIRKIKSRSEAPVEMARRGSDSGSKKNMLFTRDHIEAMTAAATETTPFLGSSEETKVEKDEFELADADNEDGNDTAGLSSRVYVTDNKRMSTVNKSSPRTL